ncbi:MAG: SDR family NAD(P)-dependent oxidoreductase, partial [Dehalococcoidia bacterium]
VMGNGKATAILFAREGARVLLADMVEERAQGTWEIIASEGGEASVFVADVSQAPDCQALVDEAIRRYGKLDILHNNVGIGGPRTVVDSSEEDWDRVMAVNLKSMMLTSKYAIPKMAAAGGGAVVNISSISAVRPRGSTPYSVSKGRVIALTQAMAIDHAKDGIRVNCIMPGPVYTSMVAPQIDDERREKRRLASPLQAEGTGWDIAWAALYLASDEARWVTGVILPVDGGVIITSPSR